MRQMDVAVGRVVYTPVLTPSGGFRSDLTIMRLGDEHFRVVTGGAARDGRPQVVRRPPAGGRHRADRRPHVGVVHARAVGAAGARHPRRRRRATTSRTRASRSRTCRDDRGRPAAGARLADLLRRRPRLGAVRPDRAGRAAVGHRLGGGRAARRRPGGDRRLRHDRARSRSATARSASSSTASTTSSRPAWRGRASRRQDFVGKEAHVRQREAEPAAVLCTLTVDDHTSASGVKRYMLGREPILTRDGEPLVDAQGPALVRHERRRRPVDRQAHPDELPAARARDGRRGARRSSTWASATRSPSPSSARRRSSTPRTRGSARERSSSASSACR